MIWIVRFDVAPTSTTSGENPLETFSSRSTVSVATAPTELVVPWSDRTALGFSRFCTLPPRTEVTLNSK